MNLDLFELNMMKCLLDLPEGRRYLPKIDKTYYQSPGCLEAWARVESLLKQGKDVPSSRVLQCDNAMGERGRETLLIETDFNAKDFKDGLYFFHEHRNMRTLQQNLVGGLTTLGTNQEEAFDKTLATLNEQLDSYRELEDETEMTHFSAANTEQLVKDAMDHLTDDNADDLILTGLRTFDDKTGGLHRKNVLVMASVPGGGKSSLALFMAMQQFRAGRNVCIVSYEMDDLEVKHRMLSNLSLVNHTNINLRKLKDHQLETIETKFREFLGSSGQDNKFTVWCPKNEMTVPQISHELKHHEYDIIYIDYISLLKPSDPKKPMWETLGDHSRHAKLAANQLNAVFVLLAQYDDKENKLKYSKAIQANANFVWAWEHGEKERESGMINVRQLKARNAPVYNFFLEKDFSTFTFKDYYGPDSGELVADEAKYVKKDPPPKEGASETTESAEKPTGMQKREPKSVPSMPVLKF